MLETARKVSVFPFLLVSFLVGWRRFFVSSSSFARVEFYITLNQSSFATRPDLKGHPQNPLPPGQKGSYLLIFT